jgi:peptidyl-prolyl cis-trans isomerase D
LGEGIWLRPPSPILIMSGAFDPHAAIQKALRAKRQGLMLRGLRKASSNWVGKTVMGLVVAFLIGSFAIWGIGDIFRGFGLSTAAKVGRTEISVEQFRQIYNERLQDISRQLGKPLTPDQARMLGIDRQIMSELTGEIALDEEARALKLNLSDAEIARRITAIPGFQLPSGAFDADRFREAIRQAGYTEQRFVAEQRRSAVRAQLTGTVMNGSLVPQAAIDVMNRYENEQRSVDYVLLSHAQAGDVPAPAPDVLAKYFDERKILFRAPEYRKIEVLALIPSEQANWIEVADADIKKYYDEHRESFGTPERRELQQILYPSVEAAQKDADRIAQGTSFADVAKERGVSDKDLNLGTLPKRSMIDRGVADAAFALKAGETSAPVQGRFNVTLIHVVKIEPEQIKSFAEVAPEIKQGMATEKAKSQALSMYDKIEDVRSEGHSLAEAAAMLKLAANSVEVDRSGRNPAGQPALMLPDAQRVLAAAFTTDVGVDVDPLKVNDGYIWFEVEHVTPARERTLDEVKDRVEASWREDEVAKRLKDKAALVLDQLKTGLAFEAVAEAQGLKLETATGLKRGAPVSPFSVAAAALVFTTPKDGVAQAEAETLGDQIVFRVTDIVVPSTDLNSPEAKAISQNLTRSMSEDVYSQYVTKVQSDIGVKINRNAVNQIFSGSSTPVDDGDVNF